MAKDSTAFQVLETSYPIQKVTTLKMKRQLKTASKHWGLSPEVQIQEFLESLISRGKQAVLPAFTLKQNDERAAQMVKRKRSLTLLLPSHI